MKTKIEFDLEPIRTPNYVMDKGRNQDSPDTDKRQFSIAELDASTLHRLCTQFRQDLFKKAGKKDPVITGDEG